MYLPPSILTLRDFVACFAGPFLRRSRRPSHFMRFIILALIHLTDYRLGFNRRPEIGDITTYGSYYEDSPAHRFARCAAPRFTPPLLRQSIPTAVMPTLYHRLIHHVREIYYRLDSSCSRDLLWIRFIMFERFITDCILIY